MHKTEKGFSLVELIVVIAVMTSLIALGITSYGAVQRNARNTERKTDLKDLQVALEAFRAENNEYPQTFTGATTVWRNSCANPTNYVLGTMGATNNMGLVPNFIERLPLDPRNNKANPGSTNLNCSTAGGAAARNCYYYASNGIDYKVLANCTPEGTLTVNDPFYDPRRDDATNGRWAWQVSSSVTSRGTTPGTGW
ncbi:hypothetical protein A3A93_04025 [Candidatus Roizmanbacteria bacterium RIFCSPLOWO2_01_FULL_38_12]|uniref:Type II secretion system protein GspG C-terminal domain-containing protein n=1 Tax=Candidatus Roizmanbacteria bacterium RIFCSPLOWO2_01_FULL_38_12 TaxID=1802061 RepID=A0A1F7IUZ9_9BACT|nr:MAG: hypothetical protein A2861_00600 [Candidatus Roizmanbacteria bacterium RIFCSPHIGHO2_01_FULL_38_15]OGK47174.1 MAG: hypothetical protein A3A93_04025 [Candidatus Roizmanbacteria bacterium RIFCSPLOWO2_01_FULL_38_12]